MPHLFTRGRKPLKSMLFASVAALSIGVASPTMAQEANSATEITQSDSPVVTVKSEIGAIDLTNSNVDEVTLREILSGKFAENAEELAGLNADLIRIPELRFFYNVEADNMGSGTEIVLKEVRFENVRDGVAQRVSIEQTSGQMSIKGKTKSSFDSINFKYGMSEMADLNLPALLGAYGLIDSPKSDEMQLVYSNYQISGGDITSETFNCEFGKSQSGKFSAKPSSLDFVRIVNMFEELDAAGDEPSQEMLRTMFDFYAQLLFGFESEPSSLDGISCAGVGDDDNKFSFSTGEILVGGFGAGIYPEFSVSDVKLNVEGEESVHFKLDKFIFKEIDFGPTFALLDEASEYTEEWFQQNARGLIPAIRGFTIAGLEFDVPNDDKEGDRVFGEVEKFDVSLAQYQNGVPSDILIEALALKANLPTESDDESLQKLIDAGFTTVDFSFVADLDWNAEDQQINVSELNVAMKDFGTAQISGVLSGASEALFDNDPTVAMMAAVSVGVTDLNIMLDDEGLVKFALTQAAEEQGAPVDAFTNQVVLMSQGMIAGVLGGSDSAVKLAEDISGFLGGNKKLNVNMKSKSPSGIGTPQMMMLQSDPSKLLDLVDMDSSLQ